MKFYQKILSAVLFVGVLGWAPSLTASPIPYSFTQYHAYAQAYSYVAPSGTDEDIKSSPPVKARADAHPYSDADASAPDSSHFSAQASGDKGSANSFLRATFQFTSTFPAIRIQYDFALSADVPGVGNSDASINSYLKDMTSALTIWSDNPTVSAAYPYGERKDDKSGSIDKVLSLILGHEYELFLSCEGHGSGSNRVYAEEEMNNIQVNAIPIPSTLALLSSGLIGLLGFRKKFLR